MSIDMSLAFNSIKRKVILNILRDAGCIEDDIKLVKALITNTTLKIKIDNETPVNSIQHLDAAKETVCRASFSHYTYPDA